ncbi:MULTISPECIES: helix-turn-helix domain-containing protein [unclassified Sporolactobacillus]|uniref:helix-turn-helix domain-containing protein n=1 Tax=unclassified Sporolactobacillus TaxID=2628533 RepID=UPI002367DB1C|nr:helix-turn-helix transcriptional regulator [Sporolactobacillus sp. CQH2019]MDD9150411.1 helix-turn-helix transcriptional regulator [Sporolactobacillus sp. CQH2019]
MDLKDRIKKIRKEHHLTQVEFGKKLNVSPQVVSNWERAYTTPNASDLENIARIFNVNPIELGADKGILSNASTTEKDEKDVAKRLEKVKKELENAEDGDGYMLMGEPISEEAKQSIIEAMEFAIRQSKRINEKYTPKKFRKE